VGLPAKKIERRYTYRDLREWPEDERWELIDGVAWNMSAAPSVGHQRLVVELLRDIAAALDNSPCEILIAPLDVLLPASAEQDMDDVENVVQPDLVVICDQAKLVPRGCWGAPDWAIEILSPYTSRKDMNEKLALYERHGVREYWIVDPGNRYIHVYLLGDDGRYPDPSIHVAPATLTSATCPDLSIDLEELFARSATEPT